MKVLEAVQVAAPAVQSVFDHFLDLSIEPHVDVCSASAEVAVAHDGAPDALGAPTAGGLARSADTRVDGRIVRRTVVGVARANIVPHFMSGHDHVPVVSVGFEGVLPGASARAHSSVVALVVARSPDISQASLDKACEQVRNVRVLLGASHSCVRRLEGIQAGGARVIVGASGPHLHVRNLQRYSDVTRVDG